MATPGTVPVTLVTILLLIAPGYLAIQVFLRVAERNGTLDRTAKIVWSSVASLVSLLVLYAASPIHFELVSAAGEVLTKDFNLVSGPVLLKSSLSTGVILYLLHVVFILLGSLIVGGLVRYRRDELYEEQPPWYYALTDLGEEEIGVLLQDGSRIDGKFVPAAWDPSTKDLVLEDPEKSEYGMRESLGRSVLVSADNISAVVFTEEDPDEATQDEVELSESVSKEIEEIRELTSESSDETDEEEHSGGPD